MPLVAGLCPPEPVGGELTALPRSPSWIKGEGKERDERVGKGRGDRGGEKEEGGREGERKGTDPPMPEVKCVDAHAIRRRRKSDSVLTEVK